MLSELVDETIANQAIVLVVARVMPVVEQCAHHGTGLPPVVGWIENARVASQHMNAFVVDGCVLRHELFCNLGRDILDRVYRGESAKPFIAGLMAKGPPVTRRCRIQHQTVDVSHGV